MISMQHTIFFAKLKPFMILLYQKPLTYFGSYNNYLSTKIILSSTLIAIATSRFGFGSINLGLLW